MREGGSAQPLAPTPRRPPPAPRSPCCGCCCSQDVGRERKLRTRDGRKTLRRGAGAVTSLPPSDATTSLPRAGGAMAIFSVYVVNKAGGLIYQLDHYAPRSDTEKTFSYPLDLVLRPRDERVVVAFGQRDGIRGARRARGGHRGAPGPADAALSPQWATPCSPSTAPRSTGASRPTARMCWSS